MWRLILIAKDGTELEDQCEILVNGSGILKFVFLPQFSSIILKSSQQLQIPEHPWNREIYWEAHAHRGMGQLI